MQYLSIWDLILTPVYLLVLCGLAISNRNKKYPPGHPLRQYYMPGLYVKMGGAIFIGLVYQFYYGSGDTFNYFYHSQLINSSLDDSFSTWFGLITHQSPDVNPKLYKYASQLYWYDDGPAYAVCVLGAIMGLFNGTSYMPIALLFAFFSYSGIWALFRTFVRIYPRYHKPLAIAFLFIPSTFVWGSALFKDTVCMFALGWLTYCTFRIFIDKDFSVRNIILLIFSFYLIAIIKVYIILAFLPALAIWLFLTYSHRIRSVALRWMVALGFIGIAGVSLVFLAGRFAEELNEYSLENIAGKAKKTQEWITYVSGETEGSKYELGQMDGTMGGMLKLFPQAVNVSLFRPYLWESRKPIILLSALESTAFLVLTLMVLYRRGIGKTVKAIIRDPNLFFFFIFTVIFAFAVGVSTGNFGTLSRYKIPCMPFFAALLLILYYQTRTETSTQNSPNYAKRPVRHLA